MEKLFGNSLEVEEAVDSLNGNMEKDVEEVVLEIAANILKLAGLGDNIENNKQKVLECISSGLAYRKFLELIQKQNGDIDYLKNIPKANYIVEVKSDKEGFVTKLDARKIGEVSLKIGARKNKKRR